MVMVFSDWKFIARLSSSHDFKGMLEVLLRQRPELNPEKVRDLIDEKKRKVGAGYLTDKEHLFLLRADLGVSFDNVSNLQTGLKDIYIGAKEATVVGRIMNIYPFIGSPKGIAMNRLLPARLSYTTKMQGSKSSYGTNMFRYLTKWVFKPVM